MKIKKQMDLEIWELNLRDVMGGVGDSMVKMKNNIYDILIQ